MGMMPEVLPAEPKPTVTGIAVTLGELVQAEEALQRLIDVKLPARQAYHVAKLVRLVKAETQHYHSQREESIRELGVSSPDHPEEIRVPPDKMPEFAKRLNELHAVETRIDWLPLALADLPDITPSDILRLGALVSD